MAGLEAVGGAAVLSVAAVVLVEEEGLEEVEEVEEDGRVVVMVEAKVPVCSSSEGWYQFPAPPRPMWAYSESGSEEAGRAAEEASGRLASRSSANFLLLSSICASLKILPAPPRPEVGIFPYDFSWI